MSCSSEPFLSDFLIPSTITFLQESAKLELPLPSLSWPIYTPHSERGNCPRHREFGGADTKMIQAERYLKQTQPHRAFLSLCHSNLSKATSNSCSQLGDSHTLLCPVLPTLRTAPVLGLEIRTPAPSVELLMFDVFSKPVLQALPS